MSLARQTAWNGAAAITGTLGRIVITGILAHRLGPALFGVFLFAQWLIEICFLIFSFGLTGVAARFFQQTVVKDATAFRGLDRWFWKSLTLVTLLTATVAALSAALFSTAVTPAFAAAVLPWAMSYALWVLASARAQGLFQFRRVALCSTALVVITLAGLAIPAAHDSLIAIILVMSGAQFIAAASLAVGARTLPHPVDTPFDEGERRQIREYAGNVWITSILSTLVWSRGETPFIKGYLGDAPVGLYSSGITLTGLVNQAVSLLGGALGPTLARMWDQRDHHELAQLSAMVTQLLLLAGAVAVGFIICFAHQLVNLLFGPEFSEAAGLVWLLAFGTLGVTSGCAGMIVQVATNARFTRNVNIAAGAALFGALALLIPPLGLTGAAIARSGVQLGVGVVAFIWLGRVLGPEARVTRTLLSLGAVVVLAGGLAAFRNEWPAASMGLVAGVFALYAALVALVCAGGSLPRMIRTARLLASRQSV